jgi:GntR family transcriptional regulator
VLRHDGLKEPPEVQLVAFNKVKADVYAASMLGLDVSAPMFRIVNLLRLGGEPVVIDEICVPAGLFQGLTEKRARDRKVTLYQLYQADFGVTVLRTEERVRAVKADATTASLLTVAKKDPLLKVIRRALSFNDKPVELRFSYISTVRYEYNSEPVALS